MTRTVLRALTGLAVAATFIGLTGDLGVQDRTTATAGTLERLAVDRVPWSREDGIAHFYPQDGRIWLQTFGVSVPSGSNLWQVAPRSLRARRIIGAPDFEIFVPAATAVWGTTVKELPSGPVRRVVRVPLPIRDRRSTWPVPAACQTTLGLLSVAFGGTLWLDCRGAILTVRAGSPRTKLRRVTRLQAMLAPRSGLWLIEGRRVHAVAGTALGESFLLPAGLEITATAVAGNRAWAIAGSAMSERLLLLTLDFATRSVKSAALETSSDFLNDLARVENELWAADPLTTRILRFDGRGRLVSVIRLHPTNGYRYRYPFLFVSVGANNVWVSANRPPFALYRISPPA